MPKRSKIVSGKVIAAVEQSKSKVDSAVIPAVAAVTDDASVTPLTGDIKSRFQTRKEELETNRKANDPINIRRVGKRRAAEEKKKSKHQQKRLVDNPSKESSNKTSGSNDHANDSKRAKSSSIEEGNFVFNRLDENEKGPGPVKKTISDPKQALQKLQAQKDKLEKLKAPDSVKAAALEEKLELKKALKKAEGVSIKDDMNLLKKSIQRREKEKNKSRESWNQKKTDQQEAEEKRQSKRNENIQSRIDAKKNKKMGIKVKKTQKPGKTGSKFNKKK